MTGILDARLKKTLTGGDDGLTLKDFTPALSVPEPEWIHVKTAQNAGRQVPEDALRQAIVDNLSLIMDPEIPINIYELGLIYGIEIGQGGAVAVEMTLTAPNCPVADALPDMVKRGVLQVPGVESCEVTLTWDPPWSIDRASEDARLALEH